MNLQILTPRHSLNKAYLKLRPNRTEIESFKTNLVQLIDHINENESEEFHKNIVAAFLNNTYYNASHYINTKGRNDLVIHNGKDPKTTVGVIIEAKSPTNRAEMLKKENINTKAFHELVLYYLRERISHKNLEVKWLVATNIYEWFFFDAQLFEKAFAQNKILVKQFIDFEEGRMGGKTTEFFYKEIAEPAIAAIGIELPFTHFDIRQYEKPLRNADKADDNKLIALYKLISPQHLLKLPFANDSNSLDKTFYTELLHIIGLVETKEGGKKLIERKKEGERNAGSLLENAILQIDSLDKMSRLDKASQYGATNEDKLYNLGLELCITWVNRILFLKLLEAQLINYHKGDKAFEFLQLEKVKSFDDLNSLFFQVLARKTADRSAAMQKLFEKVPYLNSSLFEPTDIEHQTLFISQLQDDIKLPVVKDSVLKDKTGKKRTGEVNTLEYLFDFLTAYDFSSEGSEDIQEDNKKLINASVLGLIFEKINGYKDGSFFTPGFITMYMCRETIRRAVLQKFNDAKQWNCSNFSELYDRIDDRQEANEIINSITICDPAVGSGHFLVSALNEMIAIKNDLKILQDRQGHRLKEYHVLVENDELIVTDEEDKLFEYNPRSKESQGIQETLFHEKQTIIENCLFGVDINPNSVKICRLRLWIELLKNAYYKTDSQYTELETLPNIDINIKCGNSLISRFGLDADLKPALQKSKFSITAYRAAVQTYRHAQSKEEKREMQQLIDTIKNDFETFVSINDKRVKDLSKTRGELFKLTQRTELFAEPASKKTTDWKKQVEKISKEITAQEAILEDIKNNRIYENAFEWRFEFPEVLDNEGAFVGFDVVIGNPPYIAIQDLKKLDLNAAEFYKSNFETTNFGNFDIYIPFIELVNRISNNSFNASYILPSKFLTTDYGKGIRNYLILNKLISEIVDFEHHQVFDAATTYTCIIFLNKSDNGLLTFFKTVPSEILKEGIDKGKVEYADLQDKSWILDNNDVASLVNRIELNTTRLIDLPVDISRGSSTGDDKVFILRKSEDKYVNGYDETIEIEDEFLITPIFATDYTRYRFKENENNFLIFPYNYTDDTFVLLDESYIEDKSPKLYQYLYSNISRLKQRKQFSKWYGYSAARNLKIHGSSDIMIPLLADKGLFTITPKNKNYTLMAGGGFSISIRNETINKHYLLALLNSKLLFFLLARESNKFRGGYITCTKQYVENLPIKIISEFDQQSFVVLVQQILSAKQHETKKDTSHLESEIDQLVYKLYEINDNEIKIIEAN